MLEIQNLNASYIVASKKPFQKDIIRAVENIDMTIGDGKVLGLVGESGCGKSSLGKTLVRLHKEDSGSVLFNGIDILKLNKKEMLQLRKEIQIIFQDPYSSLNPRMTVYEIITEGLSLHGKYSKEEKEKLAREILQKVALKEDILYRYPHEFSGGQRQRIAIARVLILKPEFVVCDEIVSALDVSTQAQIVNLLQDYRKEHKLSLLFISHDLSIVSYIADEIAVMYLGKVMEWGKKETLLENPLHPYTKALFASNFEISGRKKKREILKGEIPGVIHKPSGCYFHTRCPMVENRCKTEEPIRKKIGDSQYVACHLV
ncbi:MAG: ABC transporter ATP-binding protein [Leptospiraceae bacterium]|nr:ABC transporter ATP-binding protein [Leptospiraceae bacterium]